MTDTFKHPLKALMVTLRGVKTTGKMAPEISLANQRPAEYMFSRHVEQKLTEITEKDRRDADRRESQKRVIPLAAAE